MTAVNQGSRTFTVAEDYSFLAAGDRISGSTGNDGIYTVVSVSGTGPTVITVVEAIPNNATGLVHAFDLTIQNVSVYTGGDTRMIVSPSVTNRRIIPANVLLLYRKQAV